MVVRGHKGAHYNEMGQLTRFVSCREYLRVTRAGKREAPRHLALSRYQRVHEVHKGEEIAEARTRRGKKGGGGGGGGAPTSRGKGAHRASPTKVECVYDEEKDRARGSSA